MKRGLERGKAIIENLCSQPVSGPRCVGATILGRPFICLFHGPEQTDPLFLELCSGASNVGLSQADSGLAGLTHHTDGCPSCDSDSVPSQLPVMGHDRHLVYSRDRPKPPTNHSKSHLMSPRCPLTIPPCCPKAMRLLRRDGGGDSATQLVMLLAISVFQIPLPRRRWGCPSFGSTHQQSWP